MRNGEAPRCPECKGEVVPEATHPKDNGSALPNKLVCVVCGHRWVEESALIVGYAWAAELALHYQGEV